MTAFTNELQKAYELGRQHSAMADPLQFPDKPLTKEEVQEKQRNQPSSSPYKEYKSPFRGGVKKAHGTHKAEDGWAQPPGTHPGEDHQQYDPGGGKLYNPLDGGNVEPWGPQHEMLIQNVAHNYRPGPTGGSLYNTLMIRANELMNAGEKDKALELLKISPSLYQLEKA